MQHEANHFCPPNCIVAPYFGYNVGMWQISNRAYDILKALATIVLPAIAALYLSLSQIWGFGFGEEIDATITAIICFINAILGLFLKKSSEEYQKQSE